MKNWSTKPPQILKIKNLTKKSTKERNPETKTQRVWIHQKFDFWPNKQKHTYEDLKTSSKREEVSEEAFCYSFGWSLECEIGRRELGWGMSCKERSRWRGFYVFLWREEGERKGETFLLLRLCFPFGQSQHFKRVGPLLLTGLVSS